MELHQLEGKIEGALAGIAMGDAMGMPAEMWARARIRRHFGTIDDFLPAPDENEITRGLAACEVTDDTEISVILAESIIAARGNIDPRDIVERISAWAEADSKSTRVLGPSTKRAFAEIARGVSIDEAGRTGETNGASMRIIPVAAVCDVRDLPALVDKVRLACSPTHNTGVAIAAAAAVAAAAATGFGSPHADPELALGNAIEAARLGEREGYETFSPSVARRLELARSIARGSDRDRALADLAELVGTGLPSHESVPTALALVLLSGGEPFACARMAANLGGDTDTIGAIASGVCGALAGIEAFPPRIVCRLRDVNGIDFEGLAGGLARERLRLLAAG